MEDKKQNKSVVPVENKGHGVSVGREERGYSTAADQPTRVRIKMRQNRADSAVIPDANGEALVDVATADRLVRDGYADYVKEKGV